MNTPKDIMVRANKLSRKLRIDNTNLKKENEELKLKLRLQKIHCKLFHRQKISAWFVNFWYSLKWWIKPMKID